MDTGFQYYAFISYKREDEKWARRLQNKIENYRLPAVVRKSNSDFPRKLKPVFLDKTDIQPAPLKDKLAQELENSKYLIVICSPRSAKSKWVGDEIAHFIALGRTDRIIPFIIEGTPYSDDPEAECFHPALKEELPELLGVNINEQGRESRYVKREKAFIRIISKILGVSFDTLWRRHRRRRIKQAVVTAVCVLSVLAVTAGVWQYNRPFDIEFSLREMTFHNENLGFPDEGGMVNIIYNGKDTLSKPVRDFTEIIRFNDIPGRYSGTGSKVLFRLWGFGNVDTVMVLRRMMVLPISRDETYSKVTGYVRHTRTDRFVEGVTVEIANRTATTDKNGYFVLTVPLEQQRKSYEAMPVYRGKTQIKQTAYPTQKEESLINTLYVE